MVSEGSLWPEAQSLGADWALRSGGFEGLSGAKGGVP